MTYPKCDLPAEPPFLEIDHVGRVFRTSNSDTYIALKDVYLEIKRGEFISIIGHSGCGKSTLLNILAGLDRASSGGIVLEGGEIKKPGPDRMVVFQNHSLLPWLTVRQNIALGVNRVFKHLSHQDRSQLVEEHIDMVNLRAAADKLPKEISGGMKQRVGIARALALRPKVLLLDEPFGALDALTRGGLQEQLMKICNDHKISAVMVTHDVDEALLLSDRIVMMTNGPSAKIGEILTVELPRPRARMEVVNNPNYYRMRGELVEFLNRQKKIKLNKSKQQATAAISRGNLEKVNLQIGFIPLTDCAPLAIALENGFFAKHGLDVTLSRESSWGSIAAGIKEERLDAAQMVAGMPLSLTLGMGGNQPVPIKTALTLSRNGNAITLSNQLLKSGVKDLATLKQFIDSSSDRLTFGIVHRASMHNFLLRHWLASGGIDPDKDVELIVIPPAQMVSNLIAGNIIGYCTGEPWNSRAVHENIGFVIATDMGIWSGHPEKVLGVRAEWAEKYPNTHLALVKALLEACQFCDPMPNREQVLQVICQPKYLNADSVYVRPGFAGVYRTGTGDSLYLQNFNQFLVDNAPMRSEQLWILAQMDRWAILPFPRDYETVIDRLLDVDTYRQAAEQLEMPISSELMLPITLVDGSVFDPKQPSPLATIA